jgi:hypothetical protein
MLSWFCYVKRMDERRLTKYIYDADVGGNRLTFLDQIGEGLEKGQMKSTRNRRASMRNLMTVEQVEGSASKRNGRGVMYVCI